MVGLLYLKHTYDESDESVVARWVENPYWQFSCGCQYMQHDLPIDPSSLSKWRKRVAAERLEKLLEATLHTALAMKAVRPQEFQQVNVDTTVQEKAIALSDRRAAVSQDAGGLGQAGQILGPRAAAELSFSRQKDVGPTRSLRACATDEAGGEDDPSTPDDLGPRGA